MDVTFDEIFSCLLKCYEDDQSQDIDKLIQEKCKEWNLPEDQIMLLKETNEFIENFTKYAESLDKARVEGWTRKRWFLNEMDRIVKDRSQEDKSMIMSFISDTNESILEDSISEANELIDETKEKE